MTRIQEAVDRRRSASPPARPGRAEPSLPGSGLYIVRVARSLLLVTAACALVWTLVVWLWQDPITALYTRHEQERLAAEYERTAATWPRTLGPQERLKAHELRPVARRYRRALERGKPVGRLVVPRLGLDIVVANGADPATLRKGPGRDLRSFVPGEGKLVYLAGHRTTYLAPFARIDALRRGDRITVRVPYATFVYAVTHSVIVAGSDLTVLRSSGREVLALQPCHPRFFASKRYLVFARLSSVTRAARTGRDEVGWAVKGGDGMERRAEQTRANRVAGPSLRPLIGGLGETIGETAGPSAPPFRL